MAGLLAYVIYGTFIWGLVILPLSILSFFLNTPSSSMQEKITWFFYAAGAIGIGLKLVPWYWQDARPWNQKYDRT